MICSSIAYVVQYTPMEKQHVVIIGGGFGGIRTALNLANKSICKVTLISDNPHFEYYPGLHKMLGIGGKAVVSIPLSDIFKDTGVAVIIERVTSIDAAQRQVTLVSGTVIYGDSLVLAFGSQTEYFNIEGLDDMAYGFKSVAEAQTLRSHIESMFEKHAHAEKAESVVGLHMVIVGGGPNGVDLAGELSVLSSKLAHLHGIDTSLITIDLIEGGSRVLGMLPEKVSHHVERRLRSMGVTLLLNRELQKQGSWTVTLKDMTLGAKTLVWTAGVRANDLVKNISGAILGKRNRVAVDEYLQLKGIPDVYAIGDIADTPYSGLAQTAIYDGAYVAGVIGCKVSGKTPAAYVPVPNAFNIGCGPYWSVMMVGKVVMYGFVPYIIRTLIDIKFFSSILPVKRVWNLYTKKAS